MEQPSQNEYPSQNGRQQRFFERALARWEGKSERNRYLAMFFIAKVPVRLHKPTLTMKKIVKVPYNHPERPFALF
ncbi:hypothetical protein [Paenibacillus eucommiae]|uniref:Uncharacterized protein n=1 Tax=Paenibacillus eucommiae TaxID=1355755 RepID=A0ABS4IXQ7_9BACL|nr:hypothetical protein [Paenibacillus eucommiae]MBP1992376.1 hypothetical protein [Paenibacillus eucommiae]